MLGTAVMNVLGSLAFLPGAEWLRDLGGLPNDGHPLYRAALGTFIFILGIAYLWIGLRGVADRVFVSVTGAGKLAFFGLLGGYWAAGMLPAKALMAGAGDFIFGTLFVIWLYTTRRSSTETGQ